MKGNEKAFPLKLKKNLNNDGGNEPSPVGEGFKTWGATSRNGGQKLIFVYIVGGLAFDSKQSPLLSLPPLKTENIQKFC